MNRFLHTHIRVGDLDRSIEFYCKHLGFHVKTRSDQSPSGNRTVHLTHCFRLPKMNHFW